MTLDYGLISGYFPMLFHAWCVSLYITVIAMCGGTVLGLVICLCKTNGSRVVRAFANAYIEGFRNTPLLVQMYLLYFALPKFGINLNAIMSALIAMLLNNAAYTAEISRGGIEAVPHGLREAGHALGLRPRSVLLDIVLVPAVRNVLPSLTNQFILLFLASSVASIIGAPELMYDLLQVNTATYRTLEVLSFGAALYLATAAAIAGIGRIVESKMFKWGVDAVA